MNEGIISKAQADKALAQNEKPKGIRGYIKSMEGEIAKALPSVMTPERFTRITLSALSQNPKLAECSPKSFLGAMMTSAQMGLEPNTPLGHAYLIPYSNHGKMECQFQVGYKGLMEMAWRSEKLRDIKAETVYENDEFEYELGLEPKLRHVPAKAERGRPICFYAVFHTKDGGYGFEVMSYEDVEAHAKKYSKAYSRGPWQTNFKEMAEKTVLKRVLKYAPMSTELARVLAVDGTVKETISEDMYAEPNVVVVDVDTDTGEVLDGELIDAGNA